MPTPAPLDDAALAASLDGGFTSHHADVNGTRLHYVDGGAGRPLVLLGGWPQTWWQWHKVMPALARTHRVIAVDLRGMGGSAKPEGGYDKKTLAADVHALLAHLGIGRAHLVGHDIGAMVAYAHAANHPGATDRIALLDVSHPDPGWYEGTLLPRPGRFHKWWFAFNQVEDLPEQLLAGRYHHLLDWLFARATADPAAVDAHSRAVYARAYDSPEAIRASNDWYRAFPQDIEDLAGYPPVTAPLLALGGEFSNYDLLTEAVPPLGTDTRVVRVDKSGHYLPEERPEVVVEELLRFLG
ncbi:MULTISPECIES: alpha/beta fold hydrolase [unclassified Streptomyces]|uniref:alpha/beta fold hydrolase n=1 Tax=unclassified Streptomyces TaxID=2593676 RepID=UPI00109E3AB7|nr:alpha/beta hydrolase [Streptomyces sp. A1136]THA56446.1 alpha/beta hydrolase [Streptomyces sp. A1136]